MAIHPIDFSAIPQVPLAGRTSGGSLDDSPEVSVSALVQQLLEKANAPHEEANLAIQELAAGKTQDIHHVVMSVVKAEMSFRMVLELRNRLMDAYQEISRMQV